MFVWRLMALVGVLVLSHPVAAWSQETRAAACTRQPAGTAASIDDAACFGPRERLLFNGVKMTIEEAAASGQQTVTMVSQDSSVDQVLFEEVAVGSFYHHHYKGGLITIETWDGHELQVTMTHPMVRDNGEYIFAKDVQPQMRLWSLDGPTTVMKTRQTPYEGEVWHIIPATGTDGLQIVVSQDLLSGALPVQTALVSEQGTGGH